LPQRYFEHQFSNGLTLLAEKMPAVQSAAMALLIPAGSVNDPADGVGTATVLGDLVLRGAGKRDSKTLTNYLDSLGLQRSAGAGIHHTRFGCAAVASKVIESIGVYADIIRRPHLPEEGFKAGRDLALQALQGLDDDPRQRLSVEMRGQFFPSPLNRNPMGHEADLRKLTLANCRSEWKRRFQGRGAIIAAAGNINVARLKGEVEKYFGDMPAGKNEHVRLTTPRGRSRHLRQKSEQTHIGIAYPSIAETHPDYYVVRLAMEILGGGMSSRLFTEVREKRGLCYSVWAGYSSVKGLGAVFTYAGSSNDRAQATLDCIVEEIHHMRDGIAPEELSRARTGLKASTIMQEESSSSRASAIAYDYFVRGRIRTLDEIKSEIDKVTVDRVNAYLHKNAAGPFTIVTVGPRTLKLPRPSTGAK
jgi:predicted Zn-dependent peptidase